MDIWVKDRLVWCSIGEGDAHNFSSWDELEAFIAELKKKGVTAFGPRLGGG